MNSKNNQAHQLPAKNDRRTVFKKIKIILVLTLILVIGITKLMSNHSHAAPVTPEILAGTNGYCLTQEKDLLGSAGSLEIAECSSSGTQNWTVVGASIEHANDCLSVKGDSKSAGAEVGLANCSQEAGQVWLRDKTGYYNPNSELCLNDPGAKTTGSLNIASCDDLNKASESWLAVGSAKTEISSPTCQNEKNGERIGCYAELEWIHWQSGSISHESLLNNYTDGNAYEEWCADFVSYVYNEADYGFTQGERNNWDEYDANLVQNENFTLHYPQNYTPKAGDVAYFDYNGGHVEIVASGGNTPTFIYGDSGTIDPTTQNGDMAANTKTNEPGEGQLMYYLSPNF